ncbi:MAG TPA: NAD(P)/FAD-dependent oxidoreductase [Actinomycetota bacterium]|nr:NAD(P)/FAD-dependent oxidoreductase [Actinomycetota bacterium]
MAAEYDAIVVGGGHNGLVAAAYLARAGARTVVLEARASVGGAATTERPWGSDFKVSALSYVVSLMPPRIVRDLNLERHGYRIHPQESYFVPLPDGGALAVGGKSPAEVRAEVARFSRRDADALERWDEWIGALGAVLGPLLLRPPPALGSTTPADVADQMALAWRLRGLGRRGVADLTRLMTMSISDLLDDWFESAEVKAMLAVSGVIGTWAGPAEPGTAYVMLHHHVGDLGDGAVGRWGFPEGGMGAVSGALRAAAERLGARVRTDAPVARVLTRGGRATGVALRDGEELAAPLVVTAVHPKIAFLEHLDRSELPDDFVRDVERWNTRSGVVKVNLAVAELPRFRAAPDPSPGVHGGTIVLAPSVGYVEDAFQAARAGRAADAPFADVCIPSFYDRTLAPDGAHVVSMFTQWVPHEWAAEPHDDELDAYADRAVAALAEHAPNVAGAILHRQVIGPHRMQTEYGLVGGNIFHGELSADQLFHMRPAPGYADYRTPIAGLYQCGSATHGGGGVTGIPGLNATRAIARDRRRGRLRGLVRRA